MTVKNIIKSLLKKTGRSNQYLELLSYLIQNNILNGVANFSGDGEFEMTAHSVYQRAREIGNKYITVYLESFKDKTILELGPGRSLATAYYVSSATGCKSVYAYDAYMQVCTELNDLVVQKYFRNINNVSYIIGEQAFSEKISGKVDYIVSNAVLEHVWNLDHLMSQLNKVSHSDTIMFHVIDFSNHNKFINQGELYFLKFSDGIWKRMAANVGHPNRLRINDFIKLFDKYGFTFEPLETEYYDDSIVAEALNTYLKGKYTNQDFATLKVKCVRVISRKKKTI